MIIIIWLVSLVVALHYNFTTDFLAVFDAKRAYTLYNLYRIAPIWQPTEIGDQYILSNTALFDTLIPAYIQHIIYLQPEIFYKVYLALGASFVPVVAYFIGRRYNKFVGVISAITMGSWVAFYQAGSFARLNFAVLFFGLLWLVLTSRIRTHYKAILGVILSICMVLSHYGTAGVAILLFTGIYTVTALRNKSVKGLIPVGVSLVVMVGLFWWWQVYTNSNTWSYIVQMVNGSTQHNIFTSVFSRDKITQAAFGVVDPDNADGWTLNRWLLLAAWLNVMVMLYGVWHFLRSRWGFAYKVALVLALMGIGVIVLIPSISRGYGIEKLYYQMLIILSPCVGIGIHYIAQHIKVNRWIIAVVIVVPYTVMMYSYGVIPSALG